MPPKKINTPISKSEEIDLIKKKRGRPPISKTVSKVKVILDDKNEKEEEELVLHLPTFDDDVTEKKNGFTIADTDASEKNICKFTEAVTSSTEENNDYSTDYGNDVSKLISEIDKREIIIKTLKENLKNFKNISQDNMLTVTKENKKQLLNLGLISYNGNKLSVAECSKYACWWCTYNFDSYPLFLPEKFQNNKYYVFGNFCSFSCVFAYNDNLDDYRRNIRNALIKKLFTDIFHSECNIKPAGPREVLEKFGGPLTIDKYRDTKLLCTKTIKVNIPPMIPLLSYYEESTLDNN
jgi:hypothetical protein